jgi:uncharacterized protein YegP (UPF0339 family)
MRRLILCLVLVAAFATAGTAPPPAVQGQGAKKDVKSGVIEISEGKDGKFRFFVRDGEGKLLAMSSPGGFATEKDARAAIDSLKAVISRATVTVKKGVKKAAKDKK